MAKQPSQALDKENRELHRLAGKLLPMLASELLPRVRDVARDFARLSAPTPVGQAGNGHDLPQQAMPRAGGGDAKERITVLHALEMQSKLLSDLFGEVQELEGRLMQVLEQVPGGSTPTSNAPEPHSIVHRVLAHNEALRMVTAQLRGVRMRVEV